MNGRLGAPGKTRICPHCKTTILESANVCPSCKHHLRFDPDTAGRPSLVRGTTQVREGLVLGDVIVAVNGKKTRDYDSFRDALERFEVGQDVTLTLLRDAATVDVQVTLEAMQ